MFDVKVVINQAEVKAIIGRLRDVSPPLQTVAREKKDSIERQFQTYTDPNGAAWTPLKPSTLRTKRVNRDKILTRTGKMRSAFKVVVARNTLEISNDTSYAVYHQFGTRKMARRLILAFTDKDRQRLRKLLTTWVKGRR